MEEYNIKAIPTMYNGVQFRSRLEATWAAFFDLCRWDWDYEPIDLNGWIPDFIIHRKKDIYIEIKYYKTINKFNDVIKKIENTKIKEYILLLGDGPINDSNIGFCNFRKLKNTLSMRKFSSIRYSEITGKHPNLITIWKQAKNITQWFPVKRKRKILPCSNCNNTGKVYVLYPKECIHMAKEMCANCGNWGSRNVSKRDWIEMKNKVKIISESECNKLKEIYKEGNP